MTVKIIHGDCLDVLPALAAESIDAVVTDPPYDLTSVSRNGSPRQNDPASPYGRHNLQPSGGFMGKAWDATGIAFEVATWESVKRVMKPGAHLVAFGGTRTFHRMMVAIEDAGFEMRDCIGNLGLVGWIYGSGFPKSLDAERAVAVKTCPLSGRHFPTTLPPEAKRLPGDHVCPPTPESEPWDGFGTALKPGWEPIVVARKPLVGTVAANLLAHGAGAINVDGCRIGVSLDTPASPRRAAQNQTYGDLSNDPGTGTGWDPNLGRWPANVVLSHTPECREIGVAAVKSNGHYPKARGAGGIGNDGHAGQGGLDERHTSGEIVAVWACAPDCPVRLLDEQSGERPAGAPKSGKSAHAAAFSGNLYGAAAKNGVAWEGFGDTGGASRFFYTAKASRAERNKGLAGMPERKPHPDEPNGRAWDIPGSHPTARANHHPTVKSLDLMQWLVRLVTPPGGTVLDPFAGSGTTGIAADREGFDAVLVEREAEYIPIIEARVRGDAPLFAAIEIQGPDAPPPPRSRVIWGDDPPSDDADAPDADLSQQPPLGEFVRNVMASRGGDPGKDEDR